MHLVSPCLCSVYSTWMLDSVLAQVCLDAKFNSGTGLFDVFVQSLDAGFCSGTGSPGHFAFCLFPFSRPPSGGLVEDGEIRRLGRSHHCMFFLLFNKSSLLPWLLSCVSYCIPPGYC